MELREQFQYQKHPGARYQQIGKSIAREWHLPHFRIRARMIQLGHVYAKGALNYADGRMIEPFSFNPDAWREERHTFVIKKRDYLILLEKDPAFRDLIEDGKYVYADGHVVKNDPRYVGACGHGMKLSKWANLHVDQCCLRFERYYIQMNPWRYVFGQMNFDADYMQQTMLHLEDMVRREIESGDRMVQKVRNMDEVEERAAYIEKFPRNFKNAFDQVRKCKGMSMEDMAEQMHMSSKTLSRCLEEPEKKVTGDFVIMVALILQLPDWITDLLLDRAYIHFSKTNKRHLALQWIQRAFWMDGVEKANAFLREKALEPLKA